jgi:conjugative transposon TraJ protein
MNHLKMYGMKKLMILAAALLLLPVLSNAQGFGTGVTGLNGELEKLFNQMLPLCSQLIDVGRAIAGFAALWYIALRIWKHLARAEAIDFYPLLRPFAIGIAIAGFPALISLMNGVLSPTVAATAAMGQHSQDAITWHLQQEAKAATQAPPPGIYNNGQQNGYQKYQQPDGTTMANGQSNDMGSTFDFFGLKSMFQNFIKNVVQVLYEAAALCINTIRTFYLIVLAILGPLVLGLSVFDGFQHTLASWFARYVHVYMWLPVANIFGGITSTILANMITQDQDFYSSTVYIIFMIIAIVGYFTVPTVAGYIIQPGGRDTLLHKVSGMSGQGAAAAGTAIKALI